MSDHLRSLRVVHVVAPALVGGLERVVEQLVTGRAGRGLATGVILLLGEDDPVPELAKAVEGAVPVTVLRTKHRRYLAERRAIVAAVREFDADVVHTHGSRPDVLVRTARSALGAVLVSTAHGFTGGGVKNRLFEWLQRRAWRGFGAVAAVSMPLKRRLEGSGISSGRVVLVQNGWGGRLPRLRRGEARARLQVPDAASAIGWVGRLTREKGADVMVRAHAKLAGAPWLVVIGEGRELPALAALTGELGTASRVRFAGLVPEASDLLGAFDVLAISSRTEGTPMVLFEAMAAGVPVVATAVGGIPDVVGPEHARLVASEDVGELANAITETLMDSAGAVRRAEAARNRLSGFSLDSVLDRYEALYRKLTSNGQVSR